MAEYSMADLVCLHLQGRGDIETEPVPYEQSTPGIAAAMDLGTETLSDRITLLSTLSTLPEDGHVVERTAAVDGVSGERKVYALTDEGRAHAQAVRDRLESQSLVVRTPDGDTRVGLDSIGSYIDAEFETFLEDEDDVLVAALARADDGVLVVDEEIEWADSPFVDRHSEREALEELFEETLTGVPQTVFVSGEPGVGKTTLVRQLEASVDAHEGYFLYGRCDRAVSEPYQPFLTAVTDLPKEGRTEIRELLTETQTPAEDRDDLDAQRQAQFYDVARRFADAAADAPVVVFIDDLQWVDRATAHLFGALARRLEEGQLLLAGACRPETPVGDCPITSVLTDLEETTYEWLELERFDRRWTEELVGQTVQALTVPETFVDLLHEQTDGNPLFIHESLTRMLDRDDIDPELGLYPESRAELTIADAVDETIHSRLDVLDEQARRLLDLGSTIGETIPRSVLEEASTLDEAAFLDYAGILVGSGIWHWEQSQQRLYFESGVVRETVQEDIDDERRQQLHERVAEAYRALDGDEPPEHPDDDTVTVATEHAELAGNHAERMAYHELNAGNEEAALTHYREAGEQATEVYAHEVATDAYERAIEVARDLDRSETVRELVEELGDIAHTLGDYDEAVRRYEFVLEQVTDPEHQQRIYRKLGALAVEVGDYDDALEYAERGLALSNANAAAPAETTRLHTISGKTLSRQGETEEALERFEKAKTSVANIEDDSEATAIEANVLRGIGSTYQQTGQIDRAIEVHEDLITLHRDRNETAALANTLLNYGNSLDRSSRYEEAIAAYEEARDCFETIGDRSGVIMVLNNLGITYQYLNDQQRAIECFEEGLDMAPATRNRRILTYLYINLGYAYVTEGDIETASEYAFQARERAQEMGNPTQRVCTYEIEGSCLLYDRELDRAREAITTGLAIAREADARNRIAGSLSLLGEIHAKRGDHDQAVDAYEEGIELSLEYGNEQKALVNRIGLLSHHAEQGNIDEARDHVDAVVDAEVMVSDRAKALATFYRKTGEYDQARAHLNHAFDVLGDGIPTVSEIDLLLERARLAIAEGNEEAASADATRASELAQTHDIPLLTEETGDVLSTLERADVSVQEHD
jgi:tetratricopeptide (TPR) repeat protein